MSALDFFNAARAYKRELTGSQAGLTDEDVLILKAATEDRWKPCETPTDDAGARLTARVALELISHEAIVPEAYRDSVGVWTWGIGVTSASGHTVFPRYKDNPQPIGRCIEVFIWLLRERYVPAVENAFAGHALNEAQFGAALSFHYNTGKIGSADWVARFKRGDVVGAKAAFMNWSKPPEIIPRRRKERDLFFDRQWSGDGKATLYAVKKPSYAPDWASAKRVDVRTVLEDLLA